MAEQPNTGRVGPWQASLGGIHVVFEVDGLERLGELVREHAGRRALVVTDPGVAEAGHLARATRSLEAAGVDAAVFSDVAANPTTLDVEHGVEAARAHSADCLVGLGGGSPMDCAKGINFLFTNGGRMEDYLGSDKATRPMLPSIGVPTTAGTGSEAQSYALISRADTRVKMACGDEKARFRAVLLDPVLPASAPREVAAASAVDAVAHAVESYVTSRRNPISRLYAAEAWKRLEGGIERALGRSGETDAWASVLLGAHLAGAAIEQSMLGAAHACANPLTARFGMTHGVAVSLLLPHVVRFNAQAVGGLYDELREISAGGVPVDHRVAELHRYAGFPSRLRDCGIPREALAQAAEDAAEQWTAGFNPRPVDRDALLGIYESAH